MTKDPQTHAIIGGAMEVHRQLGYGFLEEVYQQSLALEFGERGIPFRREVSLTIHYKDRVLACEYRADFLCFDRVVVELKAVNALVSAHTEQIINELKATGYSIGLLLNFGAPKLEYLRFIRSNREELSADDADCRRLGEEVVEYRVETE